MLHNKAHEVQLSSHHRTSEAGSLQGHTQQIAAHAIVMWDVMDIVLQHMGRVRSLQVLLR